MAGLDRANQLENAGELRFSAHARRRAFLRGRRYPSVLFGDDVEGSMRIGDRVHNLVDSPG